MNNKLNDKCALCHRDILNKEECCALMDGRLSVDYYKGGNEVIFYENDDQGDSVLICNDCTARHIKLMVHGEELVRACKDVLGWYRERNLMNGTPFHAILEQIEEAIAKIEGSK